MTYGSQLRRLILAVLVASGPLLCSPNAVAQAEPPWKTPGHAFFGNPGGYARDLYNQYTASRAELARLKASLASTQSQLEGYQGTGFIGGLAIAQNDADTIIRKEALKRAIAAEEQKQQELVREWDQWCQFGLLLGSLTDANETIEDVYLDRSVFPPAQKKCRIDRVAYRLKYFLEGKTAPGGAGAGGGGGGQAFPQEPFNSLQITYSISGAALGTPSDGGPFEGWVRTYEGSLQGDVLRVSGTVTKQCHEGWPGDAYIEVSVGDQKAEQSVHLDSKAEATVTRHYDVSVPIPPNATGGSINVMLGAVYQNGERRFVQVIGSFQGRTTPTGVPETAPREPTADKPTATAAGRLYVLAKPAQLVPAGSAEAGPVDIPTGIPLGWQPGDRISTALDSPIAIVIPDSVRLVLSGGAKAVLLDGGLSLGTGSAVIDLLPRESAFEVRTPAATVSSTGATVAVQAQDDGTTLVGVARGRVRVTDRASGAQAAVGPGQGLSASPDVRLAEPRALTDDQIRSLFAGEVALLEAPMPPPGDVLGETAAPSAGPGGAAPATPTTPPTPSGPAPATGTPDDIGGLSVGTDVADNQVVGAADRFAKPTRVATVYEFADVPGDTPCEIVWTRNGKEILKDSRPIGGSGSVSFDISMVGDKPLPPGTYTVTITVGGKIAARKTFTVTD
ncbi:MAG TPA: FecR family protein [Armatimonadota bacterium]|nr:FecR family protein [Armatimonadota bacterium]